MTLPQHRNQPFRYNQSAITLQTTIVTPTFTTTNLQLLSCGQPPQPLPLPQPIYSYHAVENHYTIGAQQGYRGRTAGAPQTHRRCTADADNNNHNNNHNHNHNHNNSVL